MKGGDPSAEEAYLRRKQKTVRDILDVKRDEDSTVILFRNLLQPLEMAKGAEDKLISMFRSAFCPSSKSNSEIDWQFVTPLPKSQQIPYEELEEPKDPTAILKQLIVIKLNGGLGTTMGCTCAKSLIECRDGQTFFDITVDQIRSLNKKYNVDVPLVLMHSFYTDDMMKEHVQKVKDVKVYTFIQNKFPRIYEDTLEPVPTSATSPLSMWNPPGHGDVFHSLRDSGLLHKFLSEGKKYMMISNIDNLGALVDMKILNKAASENVPFIAETVTKTLDDWKGGMPILYKGNVKLLETAQVPQGHMDDFCNMQFLDYFNANNLWVDLSRVKKALDEDSLKLDVIKNRKMLNGRPVIQLEAACGSAIQSFPESITIRVPRRRFLPVKSCNEFLLMRSDVYTRVNGEFILNEQRTENTLPSIRLGFTSVSDFEKRFPFTPSLVNLRQLVVEGDTTFQDGVTIEGTVEIKPKNGAKLVIPSGAHLKDVVITSQDQL